MRLNNDMFELLRTSEPPFALNAGRSLAQMKNIRIKGELQNEVSFFVLANDNKSLEAAQKNNLFVKANIVQVIMDDLHRVGSALRDMVERLLFFSLIRQHGKKLLLTYPAAAHFQKERLHMLVTEAMAEVDKVFHPVQGRMVCV